MKKKEKKRNNVREHQVRKKESNEMKKLPEISQTKKEYDGNQTSYSTITNNTKF
jgi:hypothetical protein